MTSGANPFVVTAAGHGMQPYSTDWSDRGGSYATTNNIFYIECQDINFTVQSNNAGCSDVYLFAMAQQGALRNCTLTGTSQQADALRTDLTGGGGIVQGVNMTGAQTALQINQTSQMVYRACTFNGPVRITNGELINFEACTFNDPNNVGLVWTGGYWFGMTDCAFTGGTPFTPNGAHYHSENSDAKLQATANNIYYNGDSVLGTGSQANSAAKGSLYLNPVYPRPTTGCVNVQTFGAKGDGVTDDTAAIRTAYNSNVQVFFPIGTYKTSGSITLKAGQAMFGSGVSYSPSGGAPNSPRGGTVLYCTSSAPALVVTGSGTGNGVIITDFNIYQNGSGPVCVWNGDPSSQVLDTKFTGGPAAASPLINIQSGGGFFENGWWPNDFGMPVALNDTSAGPLYLSSIQTEHYSQTADVFSGASQVYVLNLEDEFSPAYVSISNSKVSFIGFLAGNQSGGASFAIKMSGSPSRIFGALIQENSGGVVQESGKMYGPTSHSSTYSVLDGYVDASTNPHQHLLHVLSIEDKFSPAYVSINNSNPVGRQSKKTMQNTSSVGTIATTSPRSSIG